VSQISEQEFERICSGILEDRGTIIRHNPLGTREEILLWMLMSCLTVYLSLGEMETPCFTGRPDAAVYRDAIDFILRGRMAETFDAGIYLDRFKDA
jgi:hypothetical protein